MATTRREFLKLSATLAAAGLASQLKFPPRLARASFQIAQTPLAGKGIPKFVEALPIFGDSEGVEPGQVNAPRVTGTNITVSAHEIQQKVLPASFYSALPAPFNAGTYVWAYNVGDTLPIYPGISIEAQRGIATDVTYVNNLPVTGSIVQQYLTFDESLHWAMPTGNPMMVMNSAGQMIGNPTPYGGPPPIVAHLHGAEVSSRFDGGPDQWFTPDGIHGGGYDSDVPGLTNSAVYRYLNEQEATTLWFHDHTLGATRLNVYAGMAAFYVLRDEFDTGLPNNPLGLPAGAYEREIAIQDRQFDANGQWLFPDGYPAGLNGAPAQPLIHPYWIPEFFGDVMVVNGKSWPYLNVEPRRYRLRLLDGCNSRFLGLKLMNLAAKTPGPEIWVIGNDGGLLDVPARIKGSKNLLVMGPGERFDVIVDFSAFAGQTLTLVNDAKAPYPMGAPADPQTAGQVMQFRVNLPLNGTDNSFNPAAPGATLRGPGKMPNIIRLADPAAGALAAGVTPDVTRQLILVEVEGPAGPVEVLVNNTRWDGLRGGTEDPVDEGAVDDGHGNFLTELPQVGATEVWEIVNMTMDGHPIHLHLVQFQVLNRQNFQTKQYRALYDSLFPGGTFPGVIGMTGPTATWGDVIYPTGVFIPTYGPPLPYDASDPRSGGKLGGNPDVTPFLQGGVMPPNPEETGWKDTVKMLPGQVSRIAVRFAPQDTALDAVSPGTNAYGFDPTTGPGYVWHCHIVDHEDNEMMRPYAPVP
ncbi:MAG: multicopper oxidase [Chloroflexi bacterium]|nr:multicopper oxidase [Chloroflexota bacterium]